MGQSGALLGGGALKQTVFPTEAEKSSCSNGQFEDSDVFPEP